MIVELKAVTPDAEKAIETAGRTCYQSHEKITQGSSGDFIRRLIRAGHLSVLEHAYATFRLAEVSRSLTHQLVRHRLCAFSQQSQRYVTEKNFSYVVPESISSNEKAEKIYSGCMESVKNGYSQLVESGVPREDARFVLPNSCFSEIVFSCDFRELRHMMHLRGDKKAQWEIREAFIRILEIVKDIAPNCFSDLEIDGENRVIYSTL